MCQQDHKTGVYECNGREGIKDRNKRQGIEEKE